MIGQKPEKLNDFHVKQRSTSNLETGRVNCFHTVLYFFQYILLYNVILEWTEIAKTTSVSGYRVLENCNIRLTFRFITLQQIEILLCIFQGICRVSGERKNPFIILKIGVSDSSLLYIPDKYKAMNCLILQFWALTQCVTRVGLSRIQDVFQATSKCT